MFCWCILGPILCNNNSHQSLTTTANNQKLRCASLAAAWAATTAKFARGSYGVLMSTPKTQMWWQCCCTPATFPQPLHQHHHPFKNFVQSSKYSQGCHHIPRDHKMASDHVHGLQKPRAVRIRYAGGGEDIHVQDVCRHHYMSAISHSG